MNLKGRSDLIEYYMKIMELSEVGFSACKVFEDKELNLVEDKEQPSLYYAKHNSLNMNLDQLKKLDKLLCCAELAHETFHYFHAMYNLDTYKTRVTLPIDAYPIWTSYEEELAITGKCPTMQNNDDGWNHKYYCENNVLASFGLPGRVSHGGADQESAFIGGAGPKKGILVDMDLQAGANAMAAADKAKKAVARLEASRKARAAAIAKKK